jgi:hypothetical protein
LLDGIRVEEYWDFLKAKPVWEMKEIISTFY